MLDLKRLRHDVKEIAVLILRLKPHRGRLGWTSPMAKELQALRLTATQLCGVRARHRGRRHLRLDPASDGLWNAVLDQVANEYRTEGGVSQAA